MVNKQRIIQNTLQYENTNLRIISSNVTKVDFGLSSTGLDNMKSQSNAKVSRLYPYFNYQKGVAWWLFCYYYCYNFSGCCCYCYDVLASLFISELCYTGCWLDNWMRFRSIALDKENKLQTIVLLLCFCY